MTFRRPRTVLATIGFASILALTACSSGPGEGSGAASDVPAVDVGSGEIQPKTDSTKLAAVITGPPTGSYAAAQEASVKQRAEELGYDIDVYFDDLTPDKELQNFQHIISDPQYAGVVLEPLGPQLCAPIRDQAPQANLLVSVVAVALCDDGTGIGKDLWAEGTLTYVGGMAVRPGPDLVLEEAARQHPGDEPYKVAMITGAQGHSTSSVAWEAAWEDFSKEHPNWELVGHVYTDWTTPDAFQKTQNLLTANPDIDMTFSSYIDIAEGVSKAVEAQGLSDQISVYSHIAGNKVAHEMVKSGQLAGVYPAFPASMMAAGVDAIDAALKGESVDRYIPNDGNADFGDLGVITKDNLDQWTPDH